MAKEKRCIVIDKMENNNKMLHGILGLVLNAFYFFVTIHYFITTQPTSVLYYILLAIAFSVYIAYCYTFGVKWEIKHIQSNKEKIDNMEKKIETMEKSINYLLQHTSWDEEEYARYVDIAEREGFDPITQKRL